MTEHDWRNSVLSGAQAVRLSDRGIWLGNRTWPWSELRDAAFVRNRVRGGDSGELRLSFGPEGRRRLHWMGHGGDRADWQAMLPDFAAHAARHRPELALRDGPDAAERGVAARIGLIVAGLGLGIMPVVLMSRPAVHGALAAVWIGLAGSAIGGVIWRHSTRKAEPPRIDWAGFAAREGQPGDLPVN